MDSRTLTDIEHGFHVEAPDAFVPWLLRERELLALLGSWGTRVTEGYVTMPCTSLTGLSHQLGFHFQPRAGGQLVELEFFRKEYPNGKESFDEFQAHLQTTFGTPRSESGIMGYPAYVWEFETVTVRHFMAYRYMSEEHVRIVKRAATAGAFGEMVDSQ